MIGTERPSIHSQIGDIFGNFNTLYLLAVDDPSGTFQERAHRLQRRLATDLEHRWFSGFQVLRELNRRAGGAARAAMPFFFNSVIEQTLSTPDVQDASALFEANLAMTEIEGSVRIPQRLMLPTLLEEKGSLVCKWQVMEGLFPGGLPDAFLAGFVEILEELAVEDAAWSSTSFCLVPPPQLIVREALKTQAGPTPEPALLDAIVATRASERTDGSAVSEVGGTLSYGELDCRARRLAQYLRDLGAQPHSVVAVLLELGRDRTVATLAVLRAGAALLPLDPELPTD